MSAVADILSCAREVGSPVNSTPRAADQTDQPLSQCFSLLGGLTCTNKYTKQFPRNCKQNTKTGWAWHATIYFMLMFHVHYKPSIQELTLRTKLLLFCLTLRHSCLFFAFFFACRRLPFPSNYKEMTFLKKEVSFFKKKR